ncbi:MAG: imidazoleglycerol-phosphate dehydratase HisB [Verrucomicrobiales bacterium]|nr:imidazoleglycerol-phosphate dehydratase HisB [Verrucomicrobiales bacterium]
MKNRTAKVTRETAETQISLSLNVDGNGASKISTGIGFFDHMLTLFARHGRFDLDISAQGDLEVDCHHTVEDVGIALGKAFQEALGEKKGIFRYGSGQYPMDETLVSLALDFSGRPFLEYIGPEGVANIGGNFNFSLIEEFLRAFSFNALINLHAEIIRGRDPHHMAEAIFKGLARSVDTATGVDPRIADQIPSTKEVL